MAKINEEANNLDSALKRSTNSARSLSLALAAGGNNLSMAVHAAAELAEALAKASRVAKAAEWATGIGAIVAIIGTAVAATVSWQQKQKEIAQAIAETRMETRALNLEAANDPRAALEARINAEREKRLAAIEKEQDALFGINKYLHDQSGLIAAVNAQADADINKITQSINRLYGRTRLDLAMQSRQTDPDQAFASPLERAIALNRLAREDAIRRQQEQGQDQGFNEAQILQLVTSIGEQFDRAEQLIKNEHIKPLGDSLGRSFASSIADGIAAGVQSGSIEEGFRHLTGGMLIGLGQMMVEIGTESLLAANLMNAIVSSLKAFAPAGAIGPSLALIALGGVVMGLGAAMGGGGGGGRGGGHGGGGYSSIPTIIDRGLIDPTHSSMNGGSLTARGTFVYAPTQIGIDDARAHRDFAKFKAAARQNGHDV